jgi:hypothetical protein
VTVLAVVPLDATGGADTTDEITAWLRTRLPAIRRAIYQTAAGSQCGSARCIW